MQKSLSKKTHYTLKEISEDLEKPLDLILSASLDIYPEKQKSDTAVYLYNNDEIENIACYIHAHEERLYLEKALKYLEKYICLHIGIDELKDYKILKRQKKDQKMRQFIYLAREKNSKLIKIGYTKDISQRETAFKTSNPYMKIFASTQVKDAILAEKTIHSMFKNKRVIGEWFRLSKKDINEIITKFSFNHQLT